MKATFTFHHSLSSASALDELEKKRLYPEVDKKEILFQEESAMAKTDPETKKNCLRKQAGAGRKAQDGNDYPWVERDNQQEKISTQSRKGRFSDIQIVFFKEEH